jgi:hypothetical protein
MCRQTTDNWFTHSPRYYINVHVNSTCVSHDHNVLISTTVVSSNPVHGEVYSIQHDVIKFVSDLRQVDGFLSVSSTNKTGRGDIIEILLKVVLNTINQFIIFNSACVSHDENNIFAVNQCTNELHFY